MQRIHKVVYNLPDAFGDEVVFSYYNYCDFFVHEHEKHSRELRRRTI